MNNSENKEESKQEGEVIENQVKSQFEKIALPKNITATANNYEKLLGFDKPSDTFLLLWLSFIGLWVVNYRQPDFIQILFVASAVILAKVCFVIVARILQYYLYKISERKSLPSSLPKNFYDNPLINSTANLNITAIFGVLALVILITELIIFEIAAAIWVSLISLLIFVLWLAVKYFEIQGESIFTIEKKQNKLINYFFTNLANILLAILYNFGLVFVFAVFIGKLPLALWQIFLINLFITYTVIMLDNHIRRENYLQIKKTLLITYVAIVVYVFLMFGMLNTWSGTNNLLVLALLINLAIIGLSIFWGGRLEKSQNLESSSAITYSIIGYITLIPLVYWLALINWRTFFSSIF